MTIAFKDVKRDGSNKTWVLGLRKQEHNHDMSPNPLDYEINQHVNTTHYVIHTHPSLMKWLRRHTVDALRRYLHFDGATAK